MKDEKIKKDGMTPSSMVSILDKIYDKSINGIPKVSSSVEDLAEDYLKKAKNSEDAAKKFVKYQIAKCATSGFINGLGGIITLPVTIPANVGSVLYVQMRMIACLAYMGGYDVHSDQVQTLVYICLAGISIDNVLKQAGVQIASKMSKSLLERLPGKVLTKINQKVGFRLITKFGTHGVINLHRLIPVIGGIIGGAFDASETKIISDRSYKLFIEGDMSILKNSDDNTECGVPVQ